MEKAINGHVSFVLGYFYLRDSKRLHINIEIYFEYLFPQDLNKL